MTNFKAMSAHVRHRLFEKITTIEELWTALAREAPDAPDEEAMRFTATAYFIDKSVNGTFGTAERLRELRGCVGASEKEIESFALPWR